MNVYKQKFRFSARFLKIALFIYFLDKTEKVERILGPLTIENLSLGGRCIQR